MQGGGGATPHYKSTMYFFDGTNFLNELKKNLKVKLDPHRPPVQAFDVAGYITNILQNRLSGSIAVRRYWIGSYYGTDQEENLIVDALHARFFQARLIRKHKYSPEKGVDMAVAVQMLTEAFNHNFDVGWLLAGDADYCDLVREAKRYGTVINGAFFPENTADALRRTFDEFYDLTVFMRGEDNLKLMVDSLVDHLAKSGKDIPTCPCCQPDPPACPACSGSGKVL